MSPPFRRLCLIAALFLTASLAPATERGRPGELLFGSVAQDIPAAMHQRLKPLADYLAAELQRPVTLRLSPDLAAAAREVATGGVDIAYLTPVAYIRAQRDGQVRLAAKIVTQGEGQLRLMIMVREDSPIRSVRELAGKNFAFGDKAAILQRAVVVNAGVRLEELGSYRFIGHYDNIARGVANGDFDAGILKDTTAREWAKKGLRIIHTSPGLPPYNIAVRRTMDDALAGAVQAALLRLDASNPAHRDVLKALDQSYDGFAPASDAEYDVVRQLIKPFDR